MGNATGNYTVVVDGQKFNVTVAEGNADIQVTPVSSSAAPVAPSAPSGGAEVPATVAGVIWKMHVKVGDKVEQGQEIAILEAMKMEIPVEAPCSGTISAVLKNTTDAVEEGEAIAIIS